MTVATRNKDKIIEINLLGIFFLTRVYIGKEIYARRMLLKRIVIIGLISLNNKNNASIKMINGTIF